MPVLQPRASTRRLPAAADDRFAGLQWRFVRIKYHYITEGTQLPQDFYGEPWCIDAPAAEQNPSRRVKTATRDPGRGSDRPDARRSAAVRVIPWIYCRRAWQPADAGQRRADPARVLLRGGSAYFDDFHGPFEWDNLEREMKQVFPDREIVEVPKDHPIFSCFYKIDSYPQIAGLGSFLAGRTWEKGGFMSAPADDSRRQRPRRWCSSTGTPTWATAGSGRTPTEYPGYIKYTAMAYRMGINEIVYALTH